MNLGAFACLIYLDLDGTRGATLDELNGFARRHPGGALAFAVFLISLTGIPPTIGFVAKVFILQPVLDAGLVWLAVAIALNAVLAAFYYLRVVVHMYMYDVDAKPVPILSSRLLNAGPARPPPPPPGTGGPPGPGDPRAPRAPAPIAPA